MKETFADIEQNSRFNELELLYSKESAVHELTPPVSFYRPAYFAMENAGMLHVFTAYVDGVMAGFLFAVLSISPHYNVPIGISESFFVDPAYRSSGAGLQLLAEAEAFIKAAGGHGFVISTQFGSQLERVMSAKKSYRAVNKSFFKAFV